MTFKIDEKKMKNAEDEREKNDVERMEFVKYWAEYVKTHEDEDWSNQQNILINSQIS